MNFSVGGDGGAGACLVVACLLFVVRYLHCFGCGFVSLLFCVSQGVAQQIGLYLLAIAKLIFN